jgi:hypothetical protein
MTGIKTFRPTDLVEYLHGGANPNKIKSYTVYSASNNAVLLSNNSFNFFEDIIISRDNNHILYKNEYIGH